MRQPTKISVIARISPQEHRRRRSEQVPQSRMMGIVWLIPNRLSRPSQRGRARDPLSSPLAQSFVDTKNLVSLRHDRPAPFHPPCTLPPKNQKQPTRQDRRPPEW